MLKEKYQELEISDDVDEDLETCGLEEEYKDMLKSFLDHIDYVSEVPSFEDKKKLVEIYLVGM